MKICNLDYLKSVTPGSNAFAVQVIKLFLQDTPIEIKKIKEGLEAGSYDEIYKYTHKIKPSITMIGAPLEVTNAILKINEFAKAKTNMDQLKELIHFLDTEISKIYVDLEESLKELEQ